MTDDTEQTPDPQPVAPEDQPDQIFESATGVTVGDEDAGHRGGGPDGAGGRPAQPTEHQTGERQARENAENDPPA